MIDPSTFVKRLHDKGVTMFAGVPDSLLKNLCSYLDNYSDSIEYIITANEGNAVAVAAGYHLATGKVSAVYMQNSGLGNTINPLTSLADTDVYRIPIILIIGWRGEPGHKDEPQHKKQGRITISQLEILEIPYWIIDGETDLDSVFNALFTDLNGNGSPVALVIKENTFSEYKGETRKKDFISEMLREEALSIILENSSDEIFISTTGKTSRELYELREKRKERQRDFLTVGSMGHSSSIALGVAIGNKNKRVVCLDGDGSMIMHLGALPIIGNRAPRKFIHVLLNNSSHESVGGQPTVAKNMDFKKISSACGYKKYYRAKTPKSLKDVWNASKEEDGPIFLEVLLKPGSRKDLGRPTSTPGKNKKFFMDYLNE